MVRAGATMPWLLPLVFASGAWFLATFRFMRRWGAEEAALAAGLIVAFAIATTLWRWRRSDVERSALAGSRCPRCDRPLNPQHEHARTSANSIAAITPPSTTRTVSNTLAPAPRLYAGVTMSTPVREQVIP